MTLKFFVISAFYLMVHNSQAQFISAGELKRRADQYSELFFAGPLPARYLDKIVTHGIPKTREFRTVMPGVLYRGGGPGNTRPLPQAALDALCEAGFSVAIYGYTDNFSQAAPTHCISRMSGRPNTLKYVSIEANTDSGKKLMIRAVNDTLEQSSLGPVFVHCWNGYHASGELAAVGLRQFCPRIWTGEKASKYWLRLANGAPLISRIKKFSPLSGYETPDSLQDILCQQTE